MLCAFRCGPAEAFIVITFMDPRLNVLLSVGDARLNQLIFCISRQNGPSAEMQGGNLIAWWENHILAGWNSYDMVHNPFDFAMLN